MEVFSELCADADRRLNELAQLSQDTSLLLSLTPEDANLDCSLTESERAVTAWLFLSQMNMNRDDELRFSADF